MRTAAWWAAPLRSMRRHMSSRKPLRLCTIPGDGIGHEVTPAALDVLQASGLDFLSVQANAGWDSFRTRGTALPEETLGLAMGSDAVLFGAVSSPSHRAPGYRSPIVVLRRHMDVYANLRPSVTWPGVPGCIKQGVDLLVVRENSEGLYGGKELVTDNGNRATAERIITRKGSERIMRVACEWAMKRRKHVTIVHKANVLRETCGLFRQCAMDVAARNYPEVVVDEVLVDAMAMKLVSEPDKYDVVVTTNMFGDILSDLASAVTGGLGLAPSANVGDELSPSLFEPVHGSAPDIAGRGTANPIATILATVMMLEHFGESQRARCVRDAVASVLANGPRTCDLGGTATTGDVTKAIIGAMERQGK